MNGSCKKFQEFTIVYNLEISQQLKKSVDKNYYFLMMVSLRRQRLKCNL